MTRKQCFRLQIHLSTVNALLAGWLCTLIRKRLSHGKVTVCDDGDENDIDGDDGGGGGDDDDREQCFLKLPGLTTLLCGTHRELIQTLNQ